MSWTTQTCLDVQGFLFQSIQGGQLAYTFFCTTFFCPPDFCIQMGTALAQASRATAPLLTIAPVPLCLSLQHFTSVHLARSIMHNQHVTSPLPFEVLIFIFSEDMFCFISCRISLAPWLGALLLCSFVTKSTEIWSCYLCCDTKAGKILCGSILWWYWIYLFFFFLTFWATSRIGVWLQIWATHKRTAYDIMSQKWCHIATWSSGPICLLCLLRKLTFIAASQFGFIN